MSVYGVFILPFSRKILPFAEELMAGNTRIYVVPETGILRATFTQDLKCRRMLNIHKN